MGNKTLEYLLPLLGKGVKNTFIEQTLAADQIRSLLGGWQCQVREILKKGFDVSAFCLDEQFIKA